jgi:hypothetical protein
MNAKIVQGMEERAGVYHSLLGSAPELQLVWIPTTKLI